VATQLSSGATQSGSQSQVVSAAAEEISASIGTVAVANASEASAIPERLSASSREIGDVVKLITSIAEQTNL
ncbi:hypothetical protein MO973_00550, partial [Paenibacillus sp. TRM 82003]|nr:methyl-accepting chemotaxis protein [Kineococcus sp. TRM81007]MCI3918731.1 hypothetical protein [Paenibacillus sp. TRM 82003]